MFPTLFHIGSFAVHSYGLLVALGFLVGLTYAARRARARDLDPQRVTDLGVLVLLAGLVGSKLLLILLNWRWYWAYPEQLWGSLRLGGVYYGGLIAALLAAAWYLRRHRLDFWQLGDTIVPALAVGQAIGRLGCFAAGCCYGKPAQLPWAVTFHSQEAHDLVGVPLGVALHPTQLYLSLADFALWLGLLWVERRQSFRGQVTLAYLIGYALLRGLVEIWRGDDRGFLPGTPLSTAQAIGVALVVVATLLYLRRRAHARGAA
ncbi:MAG TPA: prolipoprotein diacylglyceryl transferase [Acidobacteriota bacterium]